ncbi:MAG: M28 family peptidase [Sphingobacteriia bacterium]|nr:MAG: M28 family peptidase [Sphingobacteriia bacterium]TAG30148.1 MAG: M28 family peptidase [Sphingobacteriia bacterium]TAH06603.1 MAG: M28 family peptidase [Sphingobacteriia bacterium]
MNKYISFFIVLTLNFQAAKAQDIHQIISTTEVARVVGVLASDEMEGRKTFTKGIDKAAAFIADEFKQTGLQTLNGNGNFLQSFKMVRPKFVAASAVLDLLPVATKNIIAISCKPELLINEQSGYELVRIVKGDNFSSEARKYSNLSKNRVVLVDSSFAANFGRLTQLKSQLFLSDKSVVFILTNQIPVTYTIQAKHIINEMSLTNVVGILPGKTLPNEYVIFSGHYDHLGVNSKNAVNNDSIYNGANDDAAGTTAMMLLAKYYAATRDNERSIIFAAFTAEEMGGYGATYFSQQLNPAEVKAMFNIEMIGTESKWGKNSAYITGFDKTDMGKILEQNLAGTVFKFYPDPYPDQNLFYRSDNATLARLGVPAHTISTSKMDSEPNYHQFSDEVSTLDIPNMTEIIKSIALSAKSIISGKSTPSRVDTSSLK